ncbi:MAG: 16S rRNA (uracil(1498)-N(3))-methyltransferase [Gammaproteobacteria bacterium]|nr:MAG: 16S rRNA (uracil(1498)-N(3))-methyltransferase [Gammaproteobacteria bacterium]
MRIARVHVEAELEVGAEIALAQAQSHYLKHVLRLQPGAALLLFNGQQALDYRAVLIANGKKLTARIEAAIAVETESRLACEVIQGLGRADHIDWMIQKTTELGVSRITLFNAERTQTPMKPVQLQKKMNHWRSVAISACEQSGRALLPEITFHTNLTQALAETTAECKLLLEFNGIPLISALDHPRAAVSILLGPEGGLNPAEIDLAKATGFEPVSLGPRVLRTETAATSALAVVQSLLGDMR